MKKIKKTFWLTPILLLVMIPMTAPQVQAQTDLQTQDYEETILVGRISHIEGQMLRSVPEEEDWVAIGKDAPFGMGDALHSGEDGRAEFLMPNNTWIRIDSDTQIQLVVLKEDVTGVDVISGLARFYNKSSNSVIKATTPFGYVSAPAETTFDLYVDDESVEVTALKGTVEFVKTPDEMKFQVNAGSSSVIADRSKVTAGEGYRDHDWDSWNRDRESLWKNRFERKAESEKYLPPSLHHEAYILDDYGRWVRVYYEGAYRYFWRPVHVGIGWAPFTVGRWMVWHRDHCWIPAEPFGYMTHHYGNWVLVRGMWYWAPPVSSVRIRIGPPLFNIGFAWYPGRVGWIHSGIHIGWVPLAPRETYYCHHRWGRRVVVVKDVNIRNIYVRPHKYKYLNRAVIIHKNNFHRVNNYKKIRISNINDKTIINQYRAAPVVNNEVISNYTRISRNKPAPEKTLSIPVKPVRRVPGNTVNSKLAKGSTKSIKSKRKKVHVVQANKRMTVLPQVPRQKVKQTGKSQAQQEVVKKQKRRIAEQKQLVSERKNRIANRGQAIRKAATKDVKAGPSPRAKKREEIVSANQGRRTAPAYRYGFSYSPKPFNTR